MEGLSRHSNLVESIKGWILEYVPDNRMFCIYCDLPSNNASNKPLRIEGFIPDIYAIERDYELIIVGEAKTPGDLETRHSMAQFEAFLRHCSGKINSMLVIAVPWHMVNCGRSLIRSLKKRTHTEDVRVLFLEKLA